MHILFLSCLKATELIEKKILFRLSVTERYQLRMHKMMCNACHRYEKQNLFIENNLKQQNHIPHKEIDVEQLKTLVKEKLGE